MARTVAVFAVLYAATAGYLVAFRAGAATSAVPLWLLVVAPLACLALTLHRVRTLHDLEASAWCAAAVPQILALVLAVRVALQPAGPVLPGLDPYTEYAAAFRISLRGWPLPEVAFASQAAFPLVHVLALMTSTLTGADLFTVVKWLPSVYTLASILLIFGMALRFGWHPFVALYAAFAVAFTYMFFFFHALFIREGLAYVLGLGLVYAVAAARTGPAPWRLVAAMFGASMILAHHLGPVLFGGFLVCWLVLEVALSWRDQVRRAAGRSWLVWSGVLVVGLAVAQQLYWAQVAAAPRRSIAPVLSTVEKGASPEVGSPAVAGGVPAVWGLLERIVGKRALPLLFDARTRALLLGQVLAATVGGLMVLAGVVRFRELRTPVFFACILWTTGMGVLSLLTLTGRVLPYESVALASRFETLGFLALMLVIAQVGVRLRSGWVVIAFAGLWALLNLYRAAPYVAASVRSPKTPAELASQYVVRPSEVAATRWVPAGATLGLDYWLQDVFRAYQALEARRPYVYRGAYLREIFEGNREAAGYLRRRRIAYLVVGARGCLALGEVRCTALQHDPTLSRFYDNGNVRIYAVRPSP